MTGADDVSSRLSGWIQGQLPGAEHVTIDGLHKVEFGYSAEMLTLTVAWRSDGNEVRKDVVVRLRPPPPGLLEPYDMQRQFTILQALEGTPVRAPRALWIDEPGAAIGRPLYVMERLRGTVYEQDIPAEMAESPARIERMAEHVFDQLAAIHLVDLEESKLIELDQGGDCLEREIDHWDGEMRRVQRGQLPALEELGAALRDQRPAPTPQSTLIHGDAKCGNFAFVGDEVTGIFDWEMASIGDPMTDLAWAEVTGRMTSPFSLLPRGTFDRLLARYQEATGITVHDRPWHRSLQYFKMAVILLVGAMHFDNGFNDDVRLGEMAAAIPYVAHRGLRELGVTEKFDPGEIMPRPERMEAAAQQSTAG